MLPNSNKPLYHQQYPPRHETHFQHPTSTSTHVVDETSSEAIDHGQPQDVHDDVPTITHHTFVKDTNSQETDPDTHENNKSTLPRRSSRLRQPAVKLDPTSGQWVIKGSTTEPCLAVGVRTWGMYKCYGLVRIIASQYRLSV